MDEQPRAYTQEEVRDMLLARTCASLRLRKNDG